ncbi:unnamed protein product [Urochloa humidicola]
MDNANVADSNPLPDEVEINLDMLHALILNWVGGEVHNSDIVTDKCGSCQWAMELQKQLRQLACLRHTISNNPILGLNTGARPSWSRGRRP